MSALISNDSRWNEEWHEELLIISLLRKGALQRKELKKRIRSIQETKLPLFTSHSDSAYNYWIRDLKNREIIEEFDKELRLTELGKWLASSSLGSLFERNSFLQSFVCKKCSSLHNVVLLTPITDTVDTSKINVKGQIWVDIECPACGTVSTHHLSFSKRELVEFYNQAVVELGKFVRRLQAQRI